MKNDFLYCNSRKKKIKHFGVCDLNDTLYLSRLLADLAGFPAASQHCHVGEFLGALMARERQRERERGCNVQQIFYLYRHGT